MNWYFADAGSRAWRYQIMNKVFKRFTAGLLFATTAAFAQSYSIDWYSIDGGGGTSTGGNYTLTGTIGQTDAGTLSGGNYTLTGGFLSIVTAIQTPGAPRLKVTRSGNDVVVSWPDPSTDFVLQVTGSLATPSSSTIWSTSGAQVSTNNGEKQITISSPVGNKYFRLQKP
ncbi:hypothetical protein GC207_00410 [bacterium]|nr:hypothetical protein [bacterium]